MWAQNILLAVIGLSAGVIVASGLFSFVIELGVVVRFCRPHPHRRTHFALRGQCGAGRNTGEYFLGVPHIHTRWEYIGSSVRDSWWNICGMLGDGTCRNVECISNIHPAYEDYKSVPYLILGIAVGKTVGALLFLQITGDSNNAEAFLKEYFDVQRQGRIEKSVH